MVMGSTDMTWEAMVDTREGWLGCFEHCDTYREAEEVERNLDALEDLMFEAHPEEFMRLMAHENL